MNATIRLTGVNEIQATLRAMPTVMTHRVLQAANAEAAIPLVNTAHLLAPVGKMGNLADSIGTEKTTISRATEIGQVKVGPRRGRFGGHHAHLVEYGTGVRSNKAGANRGVMPRHPFMEPAFMQTKDMIFSKINEIVGRKLIGVMKRTIKNA